MEKSLRKYAELAVRTGVNIGKGDILVINSPTECYEFTRMIVEAGYEAGAKEVVVHWGDEIVTRERYMHASEEVFQTIPQWQIESVIYYGNQGAAFLSIYATDPTLLKDADPKRVSDYNALRRKALKDHYDRIMSNKNRWSILSIPTKTWSESVFPELDADKAVEKMWSAIFSVVRVDQENPVEAWREHNENLHRRREILNQKRFRKLYFKNSIGTDLCVELPDGHIWLGGGDKDINGIDFISNMPTEEIFTLPKKDGVEGTVVSSKPLVYNGNIIDKFKMKFQKGRIVEFYAEKGMETLKGLIETDEGSKYLGEVALVPHDSPISNSGITFLNTLYDENASCHLAIGEAYSSCLEGGTFMKEEEKELAGANTSLNHVDFMMGTEDLEIVGETLSGEKIQVFKYGNWAF
ncbi:MAG: aminopeptidase [Fusobacteriaceae bacterium]